MQWDNNGRDTFAVIVAEEATTYCEGNPEACTMNDIKHERQWVSIMYIQYNNIIWKQFHYHNSKMKINVIEISVFRYSSFFSRIKGTFFRFSESNYNETSAAKEKAYLVVSKVKS